MLGRIKNSVFIRVFWGLMGIYLLNISVDSADPGPQHSPEDLAFNDQESIIEAVLEKVLGFENAMEEYDDHDTEDHTKKSTVKIDLTVPLLVHGDLSPAVAKTGKQQHPEFDAYLTTGVCQLHTPPPKI